MREVSVRKIGNGYLRKETTYEDGEYATSEYYHRENPGLEHNPDTGPDDRRGEQLSEAIRVLKGP
jgi:hypothetical protein